MSRIPSETCWCYFRNSLHAIYREIRHIGPVGDPEAKFTPPPSFGDQAIRCRANRSILQSRETYFDALAEASGNDQARLTDAYVRHYRNLTGLSPEQVSELFRMHRSWVPGYGGKKWAEIADTVIELKNALDSSNAEAAERACKRLKELEHNSGDLIPSRQKWEGCNWQRQKWPELCED